MQPRLLPTLGIVERHKDARWSPKAALMMTGRSSCYSSISGSRGLCMSTRCLRLLRWLRLLEWSWCILRTEYATGSVKAAGVTSGIGAGSSGFGMSSAIVINARHIDVWFAGVLWTQQTRWTSKATSIFVRIASRRSNGRRGTTIDVLSICKRMRFEHQSFHLVNPSDSPLFCVLMGVLMTLPSSLLVYSTLVPSAAAALTANGVNGSVAGGVFWAKPAAGAASGAAPSSGPSNCAGKCGIEFVVGLG